VELTNRTSGGLLLSIEKAKLALSEASSVEEVVEIRDKARAVQEYVKAAGESLEVQNRAAEIRLRAERRAGELLAGMEFKTNRNSSADTLSALGIKHKQSSRWQLAAKLPEEEFEGLVESCTQDGRELTQAAILAAAKKQLRDERFQRNQPEVHEAGSASGSRGEVSWSFQVGDCRALPFPDDHFDLVFCSPPYEAQRAYSEVEFALTGDEYVEWAADCFMECLRVCKGLVAWVVEGYTDDFDYSASPFLLMTEIKRRGAKLRKPVVYQRNGIPGTGGPDWLRNDWEPIICATKRGRLPWSDNTAMGQPPKQNKPRQATNRMKDGTRKDTTYTDPDICNPGNIIKGLVGSGGLGWKDAHQNEAPFPEWLAEFFVKSFCPPGGIVLDPFSGSGTTVSVAVRHGRSGVGIDARASQVWLGETRLMGISVSERKSGQGVLV
jgi:16S rRNA G966 N2-methylase RsmD